jgi:hypothetical protein
MQLSIWGDTARQLREILVVIPKDEFAKMKLGVAYSIHPVNGVADCQWKVKEGLTITRELSLEERVDSLLERLEKLEKRLEELEKKRPGG